MPIPALSNRQFLTASDGTRDVFDAGPESEMW